MIIEVKDLVCGYSPKKSYTFGPINLHFDTGKIYCVLGANGIGKTTFFKTMLGFLSSRDGTVTINGEAMRSFDKNRLAKTISYVPQVRSSSYSFTVFDTVLMGRACYIGRYSVPQQSDYDAVHLALSQLGISHLTNKSYSELSGGEQQITLIARALVQKARFIVMDEPTSNLDFENQKRFLIFLYLYQEQDTE